MITILGNPSTLHVCNIVTRSIPLKAFLNHWNKAPCSFAAVLAAQKERPRELPVQINKPREIYGFCRFFIAQYSFPRRSTLSIGPLKASGSCIWWIVSTQKDKWTFVWPKHGKPIEWRIPPIFRYNRASVAHVCSCRHFVCHLTVWRDTSNKSLWCPQKRKGGDKICNFWQLEKATGTHPKYIHNSIHDSPQSLISS